MVSHVGPDTFGPLQKSRCSLKKIFVFEMIADLTEPLCVGINTQTKLRCVLI